MVELHPSRSGATKLPNPNIASAITCWMHGVWGFCLAYCYSSLIVIVSSMVMPMTSDRITSNCVCGQLRLQVSTADVTHETPAVDCHCPKCRKFHQTGLVSYLVLPTDKVTIYGSTATEFDDACDEVGAVKRIQCNHCSSKLATQYSDTTLVNMGPLLDQSIPSYLSDMWKFYRKKWQLPSKPTWVNAYPRSVGKYSGRHQFVGGCRCGDCQYEINLRLPSEIQHCYCRLCRQFSGGPFMTWMPVWNEDMKWTTKITEGGFSGARRTGPPPLTRTTPHGQRHFCPRCRSPMTIVYNDQHDVTWPTVGGLDDPSLPSTQVEMDLALYQVVHICCGYKPKWYTIPEDGLDRIEEAS